MSDNQSVSATSAFFIALRLFYRRLGILLTANLLWIVTSLPLVTLPAATGALFYLAHRVVLEERQRDPHYARPGDFWVGFRRYAWRSTALWVLQLLSLAIILVAVRFYVFGPVQQLRWLVGPVILILAAWLGVQLYTFPLLILFPQQPLPKLIRQAFLYFLKYPFYTLLLVVWLIILTFVCTLLAGPVFLVLFSLLAVVQTMSLRVLRVREGNINPPAADDA